MEKKELVKYLDGIFSPIGFKRKGNTWKVRGTELEKIINLQKSKYSNSYYLNYGFIINNLNLDRLEMHVFNRLSSFDDKENQRIMSLFDLENEISDGDRKEELKVFINSHLLSEFQNTDTETDLLMSLKKRPHLNDVPLVVKRHFEIE